MRRGQGWGARCMHELELHGGHPPGEVSPMVLCPPLLVEPLPASSSVAETLECALLEDQHTVGAQEILVACNPVRMSLGYGLKWEGTGRGQRRGGGRMTWGIVWRLFFCSCMRTRKLGCSLCLGLCSLPSPFLEKPRGSLAPGCCRAHCGSCWKSVSLSS